MIIVSDVLTQVGRVLGNCDQDYVFDVLTRAIELLANKPSRTNVLWDPLLIYVDIPIVQGYYVCLPPHVEKPVKVNINKQPAFTRNQFFEFSMNGPGTMDPEAGWSWQDRGWRPLQKPWPPSGNQFIIMSSNPVDTGVEVLVNAINQDQSTTWIPAFVGTAITTTIYGVLEVSKPVTKGTLSLYANQYVLPSALVAQWQPQVLYPQFEWIKLSQQGVSCKILARRRTYHITQPTDVIPLSNRQAIITACIAIKAYDTLNWDDGGTAEQNAMRFLDEDQAARNLFQRVSVAAETMPILNLNISCRDAIIAADVYDFCCDVFGPIGQQKIFDRITEAIELLANLSPWDPLIGYVDISTWNSFYVTLPQYVDQVLAINVNKSTGTFRNQWFEFNMNGLGQDNDFADQVGSNRPCGGWEEVGEMPCAFPLVSPSYLVASPVSLVDDGTLIRAYGIDQNDLPIYSVHDKNLGVTVTCQQGSYDISDQALPFKRIDRIVIQGSPQSFIQLYATDGTQYTQSLGTFWPNVPEPRFRIIKIGQQAVTVRLRYRKRWVKITSLSDPLHMRSRSAIFNALRAIQTAITDPNGAQMLLLAAKNLLNAEWRATHPHEELGLQIDPSVWGSNFVQMPALLLPLATVQGLLPVGGPPHISWLIAAIIIDAVNAEGLIRRVADVLIKGLKGLFPFGTHSNSTGLVISNIFRSLIDLCSSFYISPRKVDLRTAHPVSSMLGTGDFLAQATTAASVAEANQRSSTGNISPTVTVEEPVNWLTRTSSTNSRKASESLAGDIRRNTHSRSDGILVGVTHS